MDWTYLVRALRGEETLSVVFWHYNVLGLFAVVAIALVISSIPMLLPVLPKLGFELVGAAILLPYILWSVASLWQCAFNVHRKAWGYLARGYVIYCVIALLLGVFEIASDLAAS